ncbi:MAG: rRNA maturation RNase YbeY [Planctomycetota bacterium]|nr:rRNA maturation RNase YbeY [Planctomycetota bacterium]
MADAHFNTMSGERGELDCGVDDRADPPGLGAVGSAGVSVWVEDATGRLGAAVAERLRVRGTRAVEHLGLIGEVGVRVVGDAEMASAHERYLGTAGTTDVITFDLTDQLDPSRGLVLEADLLVCLDEAERQAKVRGIEVELELLLYVIHGVLHCAGHDDHEEAEAGEMHVREDEILSALGLGPVYARPPRGAAASARTV